MGTILGSTGERSITHVIPSFCCVFFALWLYAYFTKHTISRPKYDQMSRSHGSLEASAMSTPWPCAYWTDSLHMWHKYNPWGEDLPRIFLGQRNKSQSLGSSIGSRSRCHQRGRNLMLSPLPTKNHLSNHYKPWWVYHPRYASEIIKIWTNSVGIFFSKFWLCLYKYSYNVRIKKIVAPWLF